MDKIMSKINDTSDLGHDTLDDHRPLADSELDAVTGGRITNLRGAAIVRLLPSPPVVPVTGTVTVNSGPLAF